MKLTVKLAKRIIGHSSGLGKPSKMPGYSTALPASACKVGARLAKRPGSVCHKCYAMKGNYLYPDVKKGHKARLDALTNAGWVQAMSFLINRRSAGGHFRWHDSGDIQDLDHLRRIIKVCELTPTVKHWLPTREKNMVRRVLVERDGELPPNLRIRLSAMMVGHGTIMRAHKKHTFRNVGTSTVSWADAPHVCPAPEQGGKCGPCRACWSDIPNIDYRQH